MDGEKAAKIVYILSGRFSDEPALKFSTPYELLVAVILSAQCTDERVNKVTRRLFAAANTPGQMLKLSEAELEKYIFSCGLYKTKAKHILEASADIINRFNGEVPQKKEQLITLAGVGRKTANVVYSVAFKGNAIAVDTHVFRVANRTGLAVGKTPLAVENGLMNILDESDWSRSHHYLIYLGRSYCKAKSPDCENCPIKDFCEKNL
ncbi:MAG TPA: endonuclease III [Clostridiales bacterium]|nr:endonuclease III [Clostridiales bacterium]